MPGFLYPSLSRWGAGTSSEFQCQGWAGSGHGLATWRSHGDRALVRRVASLQRIISAPQQGGQLCCEVHRGSLSHLLGPGAGWQGQG